MSVINTLLQPWYRFTARQLGKPHGLFATLTGRKMNESNQSLYRLTFDAMQLQDSERVLEIGFGNGKFFAELNARADNMQISGIDLSHEMVTEAVKNNIDLFERGNLKLSVGDSNDLPFPDNSFNKVYCINVIYFWELPEIHLNEIHRVLMPGGQVYFGFRPAETMLQLPFTRFGFQLYDEKDWMAKLAAANFSAVRVFRQKDPVRKINWKRRSLESVCMMAEKSKS
jgi:ubiquinone/menaquinone biosynthesis C-methylase UbiE